MSNQERSGKNAVAYLSLVSGTTTRSDTESGSAQGAAPTPRRGSVYCPTLSELYPEADWENYVVRFDAQGRIILPPPYDRNPPGRRTGPGVPLGPAAVRWVAGQNAAKAARQPAGNQPPQGPGGLDFGAGGTKTGCGGKCQQAYDDHGQYSGGASGGDGAGATAGGGTSPPVPNVPPLRRPADSRSQAPAWKKDIPEVVDNWKAWNDVLDRKGLTEREKEVYRQVFAAEGGMRVSTNNRIGGVKSDQLVNKSLEELAESYKKQFNVVFGGVGGGSDAGKNALNAIRDPYVANAVGDTMFHYGPRGGGRIVRDALQKMDGQAVGSYAVTGDSINRINAATSRPGGREELLTRIHDATLVREPGARRGGDNARLLHNTR